MAAYLLLEFLFRNMSINENSRKSFALIALCTISFAIVLFGIDVTINGIRQKPKIIECKNKLASYEYKPSTPLEEKHANIYLKRRGKPLSFVLIDSKWGARVSRSSFGVYGYTDVSARPLYYDVIEGAFILFLIYIALSIALFASWEERIFFTLTVFFALLTIGIVLWRAWTADLQAQGRYLLPIVPMISVILYKARKSIDNPAVRLITLILFIISSYSFAFVGLKQILEAAYN
jgi:hypothetical protein